MDLYWRLREQFSPAALTLSVIAIVLALTGGAIAANGGLTGKQKKEVKTIAKSFQGTGPAGTPGIAGTNGTNGKDGTPGTAGTNGTNGTSAEAISFSGSKTIGSVTCTEGGIEVKSAGPTALVCNGEEGPEGALGAGGATLPQNATETGSWYMNLEELALPEFYAGTAALTFPIPLQAELAPANVKVVKKGATAPDACDDGVAPPPGPSNPEADSGFLCVFVAEEEGTNNFFTVSKAAAGAAGASTAGARVSDFAEETTIAIPSGNPFGTFAVTG